MNRFWLPLASLLLYLFCANANAQFGFHAGTHFSFSEMSNQSGGLTSRTFSVIDLQFMPGYRLDNLMGGLLFDYRILSQVNDPADVGGDLSGKSFTMGLALHWEPSLWRFLASYDFRARHSVSSTGITYKGSGFHLSAGYSFAPGFHADFQLTQFRYNTQEVGGEDMDIAADPIGNLSFGIGLSYRY